MYVFYRSFWAIPVVAPLLIPYCMRREKEQREADKQVLLLQFRDALGSAVTALRAGESPENAFRSSRQEMVFEYGAGAPICLELEMVENGLENHIPLEELLMDMAKRCDVEEIHEFADVFRLAKRGGGSMVGILRQTCTVIEEKIEVENAIRIALGNRRLESRMMDLAPIIIILYISLTSPGLLDILYDNLWGILFMTVCLLVYAGAYVLSERILTIRF